MVKSIFQIHNSALKEILKNKISFFYAFILTIFSAILFFVFSIWDQFIQILDLNLIFTTKTEIIYKIFLETLSVLNWFNLMGWSS